MDPHVDADHADRRLYAAWALAAVAAYAAADRFPAARGPAALAAILAALAVFGVPALLPPGPVPVRRAWRLLLLPVLAAPAGTVLAVRTAAPLHGLAAAALLLAVEPVFWQAMRSTHRGLFAFLAGATLFLPVAAAISAPLAPWAGPVLAVTPFGLAWQLAAHGWPAPVAGYVAVRAAGALAAGMLGWLGRRKRVDSGGGP